MGSRGFGHNSNFLPKIWSRPRLAWLTADCGSPQAPAFKSRRKQSSLLSGGLERIWSQLKFSSENLVATPAQGFARRLLAKHPSAFLILTQVAQATCSVSVKVKIKATRKAAIIFPMAVRVRFELTRGLLLCGFSRAVPSTTRPPHRELKLSFAHKKQKPRTAFTVRGCHLKRWRVQQDSNLRPSA